MEDFEICDNIFGPDIHTLKIKTVRNNPNSVVGEYIGIPQELKDTHQNIELCANIMYIQERMFLVTISSRIIFVTVQDITDRKIPILNKSFDNTFRIYNQ